MYVCIQALSSEKLSALNAQKQRMEAVVSSCEKAITVAEEVLAGDDWTLMTKREQVVSIYGCMHLYMDACMLVMTGRL